MNLLASSVSRWRIGRKVAAPTSPTAHRLAGFADHVGQDGETLCQFIVVYCERHEGPNHVPVLPTAVKSIRPSCRAFSATFVARSFGSTVHALFSVVGFPVLPPPGESSRVGTH